MADLRLSEFFQKSRIHTLLIFIFLVCVGCRPDAESVVSNPEQRSELLAESQSEVQMAPTDFENALRKGMSEAELTNSFGLPESRMEFPDHEMLIYRTQFDREAEISGFSINLRNGEIFNWAPILSKETELKVVESSELRHFDDSLEIHTELALAIQDGTNLSDKLIITNFASIDFGEQKEFRDGKEVRTTVAIIGLQPGDRKKIKEFTSRNRGKYVSVFSDGDLFAEFELDQVIDSPAFSIFSKDENKTVDLIRKINNQIVHQASRQ